MGESWVNGWHRLAAGVLGLAAPDSCHLCGGWGRGLPLCQACRADLPWIIRACPVCARPAPAPIACGACVARPPPWQAARVPLAWAFPVDRLIGRLKYGGQRAHGRPLAMLVADSVASRAVDGIVPVPLHRRRLAERGFNQALEIARPLARAMGVPLLPGACRRQRPAPPQAGLPPDRRRKNVRGAFRAVGCFEGRALAVVDDVLTTGATAGEVARCLLASGAASVEVWAVARGGVRRPVLGGPQAPRKV